MQDLHKQASTKETPQSEPIPGRTGMVENKAGGFTFEANDWLRLRRFLILGTEGGTYYTSERELTRENAEVLFRLLREDGKRVVEEIVEVAQEGLAPKSDTTLFALAVASAEGDRETRVAAYKALSDVAWTPTQLWQWAEYRQEFAGLGSRGFKRAITEWYREKDLDRLAYHFIKYRSRYDWTHRDTLLLGHVEPDTPEENELYHWATQHYRGGMDSREIDFDLLHPQVKAFLEVQGVTEVDDVVRLIREHRLPREAIPGEWLNETEVWEALLADMPIWAMLRNLGKMTDVGLLGPMNESTQSVVERLTSDAILGAGVHPIQVLKALHTYSQGGGYRGSLNWDPVTSVVDALDEAFYTAFGNVEPSGQRIVVGVDFSGSMSRPAQGIQQLSCTQAAMAMALVTANVEPHTTFVGFTRRPYSLTVSANERLDDVIAKHPGTGEGTDCAVPMQWALDRGVEADAFVLYTDNQTWAGSQHPSQALEQYRREMGIPARLVTVDMTPSAARVGDPEDAGHMHVAGFDTSAPALISQFLQGNL